MDDDIDTAKKSLVHMTHKVLKRMVKLYKSKMIW